MDVSFQTHGCSANISESEGMKGLLHENGFSLVNNCRDSDVIILNVCTVKGEERMITEFRYLYDKFKDKKMVVVGCVTSKLKDELVAINPEVSILGTDSMRSIVSVVKSSLPIVNLEKKHHSKVNIPRVRENSLIGIVPILNSCLGSCTFCSTKIVKGVLRSFSFDDILDECRLAIRDGCKEIWLTSQDNGCYMKEFGESRLVELVENIFSLDGDFRVRVGMINPEHIIPIKQEMVRVLKHPKVFKFVHLPLQAGSNSVLKNMRRMYTKEEFVALVEYIRGEVPEISLATDIICGFPGETEEDFEETLDVVKRSQFDIINISRFKKREGTLSARMDQLDGRVVKDRSRKLAEYINNNGRNLNSKWIGNKDSIILTEKGTINGQWIGRNAAYKPVIVEGDFVLGQKVFVEVVDSGVYDLRGKVIY